MMNFMAQKVTLIFIFIFYVLHQICECRIIFGVEKPISGKSWVIVDNFAFVPEESYEEHIGRGKGAGLAEWNIWHSFEGDSPDDDLESLWLLGYSSEDFREFQESILLKGGSDHSYNDGRGLSCSGRIAKANIAVKVNANSSEPYDHNTHIEGKQSPEDAWKSNLANYKYKFSWKSFIKAETLGHRNPRIVYWGFANCRESCTLSQDNAYCGGNINVYYRAHFGQYNYETKELDEFSFEYHGLLLFTAVMFVLYTTLITPSACLVFMSLWAHDRAHLTVYLLGVSIILTDIQLLFLVASLGAFAGHGNLEQIRLPLLLSIFFLVASSSCLLALLLSLTGGWTITRRKLRAAGRIWLGILTTAFLTSGVAALTWFAIGEHDRASGVVNLTSSSASTIVLVVSVLAHYQFMRQSHITITKWPQHRNFYNKLRVLGSVDILWVVFVAIMGVFVAETYRFKVFIMFSSLIICVTHIVLLLLYHPRILSNFPFHATVEDMKTYKLKKRSERIAGLVQRIEGADVARGNVAGERAEGGMILDDGKTTRSGLGHGSGAIDTVSFTGGPNRNNGTLISGSDSQHRANSMCMSVDTETGKLRPQSYFDRIQILKLREISAEVDSAVHHLNEYSVALNEILDEIDTGDTEGDAAFNRVIHENSLADDVQAAVKKLKTLRGTQLRAVSRDFPEEDRYRHSRGRGDKEDESGEDINYRPLRSGELHGGAARHYSYSNPTEPAAWKEAGMPNRPRIVSAREEKRRREMSAIAAKSKDTQNTRGAAAWPKYRDETMEGADSDQELGEHIHENGIYGKEHGKESSYATWIHRTTSGADKKSPLEWRAVSGRDGERDAETSESEIDGDMQGEIETDGPGTGKEREDALRRHWEAIELQQMIEAEGIESGAHDGDAKRVKLGTDGTAFSPNAPPPDSAPKAISLNMSNLKTHALNRMNLYDKQSPSDSISRRPAKDDLDAP